MTESERLQIMNGETVSRSGYRMYGANRSGTLVWPKRPKHWE